MDKNSILKVLNDIGANRIQELSENIQCCCFMAPYREAHSFGEDRRPSMGISINEFGDSLVHCFACKYSSNFLTALIDYETCSEIDIDETISFAKSAERLDPDAILRSVLNLKEQVEVEKILNEECLDSFPKGAHKSILSRGLKISTLKEWDSRRDDKKRNVLFPVKNLDNNLVGAVGRTVIRSRDKYYNYFKFDKSKYLFGENKATRKYPVIVTEGLLDTILLWQYCKDNDLNYDVVGLLGSEPSKEQLQKLVTYWTEVILFLDNDVVGWEGQLKLKKYMQRKTLLRAVIYPRDDRYGDPADLVKDNYPVVDLLKQAPVVYSQRSLL